MSEEKKQQTAIQLFASYMRSVERVRALSKKLAKETEAAMRLSHELAERFGIRVSGNKPKSHIPSQTTVVPEDNVADYKPPPQYHSDAPRLAGSGSQDVADIRRESGLTAAEADSEALTKVGTDTMRELQRSMKGLPTVVPAPGEHQEVSPVERSNADGGPVTQGPIKEE